MEQNQKQEFIVTSNMFASQGQRLGNYFIDLIFQYILIFVLSLVLGVLAGLFGIDSFLDWAQNIGGLGEYLIGIIITVIYYLIAETLFSRTIGKLITKTVVVDINGEKPDGVKILKRTFSRLIPFNHFSFLGGNTRGWHDSLSDTYVVKKDLLDERKNQFYELDEIGKIQE
ncbi:RDD family protein [Flavobacterium lacisediminis]|uniref:RDD family protein n=1 Tax=Flavobacterium lacisediminis TaxID=2989705 RepID=A0ABT3EHF8_9FLAO|nr:RDD family protein [Flavobacterium lacisediminis]MCW1148012.1 RDD family protein [Flavobacterium lacisediminis]